MILSLNPDSSEDMIVQWNLSIAGIPQIADKTFSPKRENLFYITSQQRTPLNNGQIF